MKAKQKKNLRISFFAAAFLMLGLVTAPKSAVAAPAPIIVQFASISESSMEDNGAVAALLSFKNSAGVNVSHQKLKLTYQITGTASPSDYVFNHAPGVTSGIIEVPAGTGNVAVLFGHIPDTIDESDETVIVKITGVSYTGNTPVVLGANKVFTDTILDDDAPTFNVQFQAPTTVSAPESTNSFVYLTFTDGLGNNSVHQDVYVEYQITGTADSSDFSFNGSSALNGILLLPAGAGPYPFVLGIPQVDDVFESDESLTITITGVSDKDPNTLLAIGASSTFTRTIINDDFPQYVEFNSASASGPESQSMLVTLKLVDAFGNSYNHPQMYVQYQITGTADSSDFSFNGSSSVIDTMVIPAGNGPYVTFFVPTDDYAVEPDETVVIKLVSVSDSNPDTDLRVGVQDTFTHTIVNDDVYRFVQFRNLYTGATEDSRFGTSALMFSDEFGNPIARPAMDVYYEITGTASSSDFTFEGSSAGSGVIHVNTGSSVDLVLNILSSVDELVEGNESVVITLTDVVSNDPNFIFEVGPNNTWTHTIINDDTQLYLQMERSAISSVENQPTLDDFVWMKLVDDIGTAYYAQDPITVAYQFLGGTANPVDDFTIDGISSALSGSVTLSPVNGKYIFPLSQVYDDVVELDETVAVNLVGDVFEGNQNIVISRGEYNSIEYTIVNDDFDVSPASASLNITAGTASSRIYSPDAVGVELGKWNFAAAGGDVQLTKLSFENLYAADNSLASTIGNFGTLLLYDGATLLDTAIYVNGRVVFAGFKSFIPVGSPKVYTLKGNINSSGVITNNVATRFVIKSDNSADVEGRDNDGRLLGTQDINYNLSSNSGPAEAGFAPATVYIIHNAFPTVSTAPVGGALTLDTHAKIFKFSITNSGTRDLRVSSIKTSVQVLGLAGQGAVTNFRLFEDDASGGLGTYLALEHVVITSSTNSSTLIFNSTADQNNLLDNLVVAPGATRTFIVTANTTNMLGSSPSGSITIFAKIAGSTGWNGTAWNTGDLIYFYTPFNGSVEQGPFSASNSYPVAGSPMTFSF